ncbi:MAG: QueT transporter family protein, partial [candidate division Zixibacteria bacterium]|nr:QueT transporter family protein [candidate division Zixibacteria bacterium]
MKRFTVKELASAGLIASLYTVLSLAFMPISFGVYQIRVAEALTVLPFLTRAAVPGLYIGCLLANIIGGMGWLDIVFGPLITLAAALITRGLYHLSRRPVTLLPAVVPVVLMWGGSIYLLNGGAVTINTVSGVGLSLLSLVLILFTEKKRAAGAATELVDWLLRALSMALALVAVFLLRQTDDTFVFLCGAITWLATPVVTALLARLWFSGDNPNLLIAPLPPVLLNAFGVSAYLAPLIGVSYWFSVQM